MTMVTGDINELFDPEQFRSLGKSLIDVLSDYLHASLHGQENVLAWKSPQEATLSWQSPLPRQGVLNSHDLLASISDNVLANTLRIHHPRNLGHQVAPPLPAAALCDLVAAY